MTNAVKTGWTQTALDRLKNGRSQPTHSPAEGAEPVVHVRWELAKRGITQPEINGIVDILTSLPNYNSAALVDDARHIERELSGIGPLTDLLMDPAITDVVVNPNGDVWCDRGDGMELWNAEMFSELEIRELAVSLADRCGTRLDDARPFADGVLTTLPRGVVADGVRVHAVLSPPAADGASISLRVLRQSAWPLSQLVDVGMCGGEVAEFLEAVVGKRKNLLITGGTGAGKTTLLAGLIDLVEPTQRIVVVEDTPELMPTHSNLVKLVTRKDNADGSGELSMQLLVKQCLRMRPDRIVVGEVRGAEIADLLVAFNTGHAGSAGTLHANSAQAVPGRLMALGAMAGLPRGAVIQQVGDGVDYLLHLDRVDGVRRLAQIGRFRVRDGGVEVELIWDNGPTDFWAESCASLEIGAQFLSDAGRSA